MLSTPLTLSSALFTLQLLGDDRYGVWRSGDSLFQGFPVAPFALGDAVIAEKRSNGILERFNTFAAD